MKTGSWLTSIHKSLSATTQFQANKAFHPFRANKLAPTSAKVKVLRTAAGHMGAPRNICSLQANLVSSCAPDVATWQSYFDKRHTCICVAYCWVSSEVSLQKSYRKKESNQSINQSIDQKRISDRRYCHPRRMQGRCHAIDAVKNFKLMTSCERRRMIVAVRTSEQFRLQRLSKPGQRRQRRY